MFLGMPLTLPASAWADEPLARESPDKLGDIQVKADKESPQDAERRMAEESFFLPYSPSAVGAESILEKNAANATDAISDMAGVSVLSQGAFNRSLSIRGLDGPRVVTLVDGVKIGNQGMSHSGAGELNMTDIHTVEQIEVVRGSPSVIYDSGASGGVVNVVSASALVDESLGFKQVLGYDQGYGKTTSSTQVRGGNGDVGASVTYTYEDATDYRIAGGDEQKDLLISQSNDQASQNPGAVNISDLGYRAESLSARAAARVLDDGRIEASVDRWLGRDINFIHGPTIGEALVIHYDRMQRDTNALRFKKQSLGALEDINLSFANQKLVQEVGSDSVGTTLNSNTLNLSALMRNGSLRTRMGAELSLDDAETLVSSTQDYYAMFANVEYALGDFLFSGGLRGNGWRTTQELLAGSNPTVAKDLYGISGITPPMDESSPTWSLGAVYMLNEQQNLALNFNTTYRNPDLYERYAFGGVYGGGAEMVPESGRHVEALWKYLDQQWAMTASLFYSDFDNYITTKNVRQLTNPEGLRQCVAAGICDPVKGDFNGRENEFFSQFVQYYNAEHVTNQGAEFSARYDDGVHDVRAALGYNDTRSNDVFVIANSQPIRLNLSYKHRFAHEWKPWAMAQAVGVSDTPEVRQYGGFEPYALLNLYAGLRVDDVLITAGVGNVTDTVYHPPYGGINGLARYFFLNLTYDFDSKRS